ncbi:MAG: protein translocase subunit SecD [Candidatus Wildermuthbacteria bacterium]|nr:protein translocase subunit SecD [Candidatus Wildermuthbacteria bacterium]
MGKIKIIITLLAVFILVAGAAFFVQSPVRPFQLGLDLQGGIHLVYEADISQIAPEDVDSAMSGLRDVIEKRVNLFGVKEPVVQIESSKNAKRLIIELAGVRDSNEAIKLIGQTPYLEFREPKANYEEIQAKNQELADANAETGYEDPFEPTQLSGRYLTRAELGFDSVSSTPVINLQFNDEGSGIFEEMTSRNIGKPIVIFLDYEILQAPVVQDAISGGKAQITGSFSIKEAKQIVQNLNAGALPLPIALISQQSVGATLGSVSLQQSLRAGIAGFLGVLLFMVVFYRALGILAAVALLMYFVLLLALFKLIPVTMTLAGIAGFILSIGMAVDVNILIFSRMKEELKSGRDFSASVSEGFRRAWPSIRDGHVTTFLVGLVLFFFGSSFVQGFALTLCIGLLMSLFTALFVTRNLLGLFTGTKLQDMKWLWK